DMSDERTLPVFPLKNAVLYPHTVAPLSASRPISVQAIEAAATSEEKELAVFTQRDPKIDDPGLGDLYGVGTVAVIKRMLRGPEGIQLIVQGVERVELKQIVATDPFLRAELHSRPVARDEGAEVEALQRRLLE